MILFLNLNNIISQVYIDKKAILYHDIYRRLTHFVRVLFNCDRKSEGSGQLHFFMGSKRKERIIET